jgi:predicted secreted protein|tara:strand:- start:266 stop:688 length:423 start_codon:yes stop_codon:yes gene_type:complete
MAKINGTDFRFYVGTTLVGNATEGSVSLERDLPDASDKDSGGWAENIQGQKSWSMSCTAFLNFVPDGTDVNFVSLFSSIFGTSVITVKFSVATGVTQASANEYIGTANLSSLSLTAPLEDVMSFDLDATGTGPLVQSVIV